MNKQLHKYLDTQNGAGAMRSVGRTDDYIANFSSVVEYFSWVAVV